MAKHPVVRISVRVRVRVRVRARVRVRVSASDWLECLHSAQSNSGGKHSLIVVSTTSPGTASSAHTLTCNKIPRSVHFGGQLANHYS